MLSEIVLTTFPSLSFSTTLKENLSFASEPLTVLLPVNVTCAFNVLFANVILSAFAADSEFI